MRFNILDLPDFNDPIWRKPPAVVPPPEEPNPPINQDDPKPPPFVPPVEPPAVTPPVEDVPVEDVVNELSDIIACPDDTGQTRGFTLNPPALSDCECQDEIFLPLLSTIGGIAVWVKRFSNTLLASRADEVGDIYKSIITMKKNVTTKVDQWIDVYDKAEDGLGTSFVDDALKAKRLADSDEIIKNLRVVANKKIIAAQNEAKNLITEVRAGSGEFKSTFFHHNVFNIAPEWDPKLKQYVLDTSIDQPTLTKLLNERIYKWKSVDNLSDAEVAKRTQTLTNSMPFLLSGTTQSSEYMDLANVSVEFKLSRIGQLKDSIRLAEKTYEQGAKGAQSIAKTYKQAWDEELIPVPMIDLPALKESGNPMRVVVHQNVPMTRKEFLGYLDELKKINAEQRLALGADLKGLDRAKQQGEKVYRAYVHNLALKYTAWAGLIGGLVLDILNIFKFTERRVCWTNPQNSPTKEPVDFDSECKCTKCPEHSQLCEHEHFRNSRTYVSGQLPLGVTIPGSRTRTELNECVKDSACPPGREIVSLSTYQLLWDSQVPHPYDRKPCTCWCKDREHTNKECNKAPGKQLPRNPDYTDSYITFVGEGGGIVCAQPLPPDGKSETSWLPWAKSAWHWDKDQCGYVCRNGTKPEECAVDGLGILAEGDDPWDFFDVEKCECYGSSQLDSLLP